jgi:hypothetical protein
MGPNRDAVPNQSDRVRLSARLESDVAMLWELVERGISVDGEAYESASHSWLIYGRTAYDGEVILAEYADADEAAAVWREIRRRL